MAHFSTLTLDSTEKLALAITRDEYAYGDIDHDELTRRIESIIGLNGADERRRVLTTEDYVETTTFGDHVRMRFSTAWEWPS